MLLSLVMSKLVERVPRKFRRRGPLVNHPSYHRSPTLLADRTHMEAKTRPFSVQRFDRIDCPVPLSQINSRVPSPSKDWPPPAVQYNNKYCNNILHTRSHIPIWWPVLSCYYLLLRQYLLIRRCCRDIVIF